MQILGLAGSLRRDSYNRLLLRAASSLLPGQAALVEFDGLKAIPPYDQDDELAPGPEVIAWREAIASADGLLFATPEYNASIPGVLKNAVDWASRPIASTVLRNKPAAVIGASTGMFGAVWAQAELRKSLSAAGARVIERELPVSAAEEAFDDHGALLDRELERELASILSELVEEIARRGSTAMAA
jgi:chromate reductase, NAD(P)H dehydrogenase (quinone)